MTDEKDTELDRFFDAAKATTPRPPEALMARVLADAEAAQPAPRGLPMPEAGSATGGGWFGRWLSGGFSGWRGATALGVVCLGLGLSVGYWQPTSLSPMTDAVLDGTGVETATEYLSLDDLMSEV